MKDIIHLISSDAVQDYVMTHEDVDVQDLVLHQKEILGLPSSLIAQQILGRRKAKEKLPSWYATPGIIYPPSLNLEQASSELTAKYKSDILKDLGISTDLIVDLTGGFGIDSYSLSFVFRNVIHVEPDDNVSAIATHNHRRLGRTIQHVVVTAEQYMASSQPKPGVFYIDPSRRNDVNKRVFKLKDTTPDVTTLVPRLLSDCELVLIKASPMLDLTQARKDLPSVFSFHVVAVDNECKELLIICKRGFDSEPRVDTINIGKNEEKFSFMYSLEEHASPDFSRPLNYLYEPNAAILKAGAFKSVATAFSLSKIHVNTHLYTSNELFDTFPGRIFQIRTKVKSDAKQVGKAIPTGKANVITRNYPLTPEEIKKKLRLSDGGDDYLICTTALDQKHLFVASRIK